MTSLIDPRFDFFVGRIDFQALPNLAQFAPRLPSALDSFHAVLVLGAHQLRDRSAMAGDDDLSTLLDLLDELERCVFASKMPTCFIVLPSLTS